MDLDGRQGRLFFLLENVWEMGPIAISDSPPSLPDGEPALTECVRIPPLSLAPCRGTGDNRMLAPATPGRYEI